MKQEKEHFLDKKKNVRLVIVVFYAICALLFALEFTYVKHLSFSEGEIPQEAWTGSYAIYGFAACTILILSAIVLRKVVMRKEDYYHA